MLPVAPFAARTKPSIRPPSNEMWLSFHDWLAPGWVSQVLSRWNMGTGLPCRSGFVFLGVP